MGLFGTSKMESVNKVLGQPAAQKEVKPKPTVETPTHAKYKKLEEDEDIDEEAEKAWLEQKKREHADAI